MLSVSEPHALNWLQWQIQCFVGFHIKKKTLRNKTADKLYQQIHVHISF